MDEKFTYKIGGETYIQKPLVLGQINQLAAIMRGIELPGSVDVAALVVLFGSKLPMAIAIVLIEEAAIKDNPGSIPGYLMERDIDKISKKLEFTLDSETAARIVEDFFDCNPIASLLSKFTGISEKIAGKIQQTELSSSASTSQTETSQKETTSSGVSLSENASPT